jgi:IclR family transcriptional regulator, KDG regulon repressor
MANDAVQPESQKGFIQSLDRGLQLLETLSTSPEPMGLPELSEILDVDRSTVYRLLSTLLQRGYVSQDAVTKRYRLGFKVVELGRRAIDSFSLRTASKPYLKALMLETGESVNLVVLSSGNIISIDHEPSPSPLAVSDDIGSIFIPYATASGKAILAYLPDAQVQEIMQDVKIEAFTARTITSLPALQNHFLQVREKCFAVDDEERYIGVRCIASPIFDHRNKAVGAIGISGPTTRITLDAVGALSRLVVKAACAISRDLGNSTQGERNE